VIGAACLGLAPPCLHARTESDRDFMEENQICVVTLGRLTSF